MRLTSAVCRTDVLHTGYRRRTERGKSETKGSQCGKRGKGTGQEGTAGPAGTTMTRTQQVQVRSRHAGTVLRSCPAANDAGRLVTNLQKCANAWAIAKQRNKNQLNGRKRENRKESKSERAQHGGQARLARLRASSEENGKRGRLIKTRPGVGNKRAPKRASWSRKSKIGRSCSLQLESSGQPARRVCLLNCLFGA